MKTSTQSMAVRSRCLTANSRKCTITDCLIVDESYTFLGWDIATGAGV